MILLKKNIKNLLSEELSVEQRGLMITLFLCIEKIPALTQAKFEHFVDIKKFRSDLIYLHEEGYIKWQKYNYAKKAIQKLEDDPKVHEIIKFMNELYGRRFDSSKEGTVSGLRGLLTKYSTPDIKLVIANRYEEWKDEPTMAKHLNPITVFRKKLFEKYLEEATRTGVGSGITKAVEIGLGEGDQIYVGNVSQFSDNDLYTFKTFNTDSEGQPKGNPLLETKYGKVLKKMVNVQENEKKMNGIPSFIYTFVKR